MKELTWGQLLRQARETAGLSQQALATRAGLNVSYISRLERGSRRPRRQALLRLAAALQIKGSELVDWLTACDLASLPLLSRLPALQPGGGAAAEPQALEALEAAARLPGFDLGGEEIRLHRLTQALAAASPSRREAVIQVLATTLDHLAKTLQAPVTWAVIPAAGGQHRVLATPIMQRLLLQAISEAAAIGLCHFLVVLAPGTVDTLWRPLQTALSVAVAPKFTLEYLLQPSPTGLGEAVLLAAEIIGDEPFLVLLPDEMLDQPRLAPWPQELLQMARKYQASPPSALVAVARLAKSYLPAGGVARLEAGADLGKIRRIAELVEKPPADHPICADPQARTIFGRYFLPPAIFTALREIRQARSGNLELTWALELLRHQGLPVWAYEFKAPKQDLGGVIGRAEAMIHQLE